jgi:outer membrane protein OmpA-like peptidoglycan-associated protein
MPVYKCSNGMYRIGNSDCIYDTEQKANDVWKALLAKGIYAEETYNDYPKSVTENAKRALKWADENGWGGCGTQVGKTRANQLANRESISRDTIARMSSFRRHQQSKDVPYGEGCGKLMWDAWGGDEGIDWAERKLKEIDSKFASAIVSFDFDDTLTRPKYQDIAQKLISRGAEVHIVTRRQEKTASAEVYKLASELGIKKSNIHFTNGKMKWEYLKNSNIQEHYDNNKDEIDLINKNTEVKGIWAQ